MSTIAEPDKPTACSGNTAAYVGRFAPSPTGPLHMGSLIAALASYLDARAASGQWLLRMEDLDPPREPAGAAEQILEQLRYLEMHWDGEVLYQSQRHDAYAAALSQLDSNGLLYRCSCSRQRIRELNGRYDGHCRTQAVAGDKDCAIRLQTSAASIEFTDRIQGKFSQAVETEVGDFVIRRKDGLFAYQLAVVVDDGYQQITDVVRGYDLLDSTPRQIYLQSLLGLPRPNYAHFPVLVNDQGQKLSKQHFAAAVDISEAGRCLFEGLKFLGLQPPRALATSPCAAQLAWGIEHWDIQAVPKLANIPELSF
ncbi:MAG: tRNA glutamyl-Q(34) synthetase GluQRS [Pseudomonadales bacterium]|nr:tRNA glutamyl-Q(34) synthetase GluQRS [Pseudomonadales bacterium]